MKDAVKSQVTGAWNVRLASRWNEASVQFSSVAALWGSAGQGNYAVANAMLDMMANAACVQGTSMTSVQWGTWSNAGMAAEKGTLDRARRVGTASMRGRACARSALGSAVSRMGRLGGAGGGARGHSLRGSSWQASRPT